MRSGCDRVGNGNLATLLGRCDCGILQAQPLLVPSRTRAVDSWERRLLMSEEHWQQGRKCDTHIYILYIIYININIYIYIYGAPPRVKRTCRVFPRPGHRRVQCLCAACSDAPNTSTTPVVQRGSEIYRRRFRLRIRVPASSC